MHSKYNYSPSATSLRFNKSTSNEKFYRQATVRAMQYDTSIQSPTRDCLACKHQHQIPVKLSSNHSFKSSQPGQSSSQHQDYYPQPAQQEMDNLRKSKRFLEELLDRNKLDYRIAIDKSEERIAQLMEEMQQKNRIISQLERKINANQLLQQLASASMVGTYVEKTDTEERDKLNGRIKQLGKVIEKLQIENETLRVAATQQKQDNQFIDSLQQRVKECQVYARQYESMKLLIHKMEIQKEEILKKHEKSFSEMGRRHKEELDELTMRVEEVKEELRQRDRLLDGKEREIEKTRLATEEATNSQWERLQELLQQKNEEVDRLESKLNCIQSELTFLKNRYGYLLKLTKNATHQEITSNSDLQDYCIERIGRHNISNGKQSIMGLNLSPIKRR